MTDFFKIVSSDSAVGDLLGTGLSCKVYPFGEAPQDVVVPYCVYQGVSDSPINNIGHRPCGDETSLQIDVYAATGKSAEEIVEAIEHAIELSCYVINKRVFGRDKDTRNYRISMDTDWVSSRS